MAMTTFGSKGDSSRRSSRALAVLVILGAAGGGCRETVPVTPPPAVTVVQPVRAPVTEYFDFTGNTAATDSVTLVARVEGYLEGVHFVDGARVKQGDVLFTIQQDQYRAQLQQAEAQAAAQRAALEHAETELVRYTNLVKEDSAPQTEVDRWRYERDAAKADLLAAEAQITLAKLNLSYTLVRAPFDGKMGRHLVDPGNLVGAMGQQTSLAEINRIDPLYVYFTVNERDLLQIAETRERTPHRPVAQQPIPVAFGLLNEDGYPHRGRLDFAALSVAPTTGTLQLRGTFPNPEPGVLPGLFARVRVPAGAPRDALLIPGEALRFDQQGEYLLLVNEANVVERRSVKTGAQVGERFAVLAGLRPEDWVVTEGLTRAVPGRSVVPERSGGGTPPSPASAPAQP